MDEIKSRLQETSEHCFKCYEAWSADKKSSSARGALQESVHELRKVASRLEIEIAVSERNEVTQKPIPVPPHRDAQRRSAEDDSFGNGDAPQVSRKPRSSGGPRRRGPKKETGGNA